jgi:hypothetical protein
LPFESGDEAEIVEHGRAEEKGDVANGFDGGFGDGFYVGDLRLGDVVVGRDELGELADFDEKGTKGLADLVVKLAGDGAAFFFLSFDHAGGEAFEFEAAAVESLIAETGLFFKAEDVPAANQGHEDAGDEGEGDEPDEAGLEGLKTRSDGEVFEGELMLVERRDL